jgi:Arc/MetJ-type ribon-helix-helix transcriptional regulator
MARTKITIRLGSEHVEEVRRLVRAGHARSFSGFVTHAVAIALHDAAGWRQMLADALEESGGPLTRKEREWAVALLGLPRRRTRGEAGAVE